MTTITTKSAAIFDLDGTLLDTETISTIAINKSVAKYTQKTCEWSLKKEILGRKSVGPEGMCMNVVMCRVHIRRRYTRISLWFLVTS